MDNFSSYCLYVATFTVSVFWAWQYDKRKHIGVISSYEQIIWLILIALPSILLQGFRYGVGTDYYNYAELCEGLCNGNSEYWSWYLSEPIFIWICKIAYFIGNQNKYFFFIVNAVLKDVLLFYIFDYYKDEGAGGYYNMVFYKICFGEETIEIFGLRYCSDAYSQYSYNRSITLFAKFNMLWTVNKYYKNDSSSSKPFRSCFIWLKYLFPQ